MFTTYLISHVHDLPTQHSKLSDLSRFVGMCRWYIMLSHDEIEVHNSRRRYAIFTYGKVQLPLSLIRHDIMRATPRLLSSLLDSHPLSVPRPHGTNRTEPYGRYGSIADQKKVTGMNTLRQGLWDTMCCSTSCHSLFFSWSGTPSL